MSLRTTAAYLLIGGPNPDFIDSKIDAFIDEVLAADAADVDDGDHDVAYNIALGRFFGNKSMVERLVLQILRGREVPPLIVALLAENMGSAMYAIRHSSLQQAFKRRTFTNSHLGLWALSVQRMRDFVNPQEVDRYFSDAYRRGIIDPRYSDGFMSHIATKYLNEIREATMFYACSPEFASVLDDPYMPGERYANGPRARALRDGPKLREELFRNLWLPAQISPTEYAEVRELNSDILHDLYPAQWAAGYAGYHAATISQQI